MKKIGILISLSLISFLILQSTFVFSAGDNTPPAKKIKKVDKGGGFVSDKRFTVNNISFMSRFEYSGKGQVLEVLFDINNQTEDPVDLEYAVVTIYETDRVIPKERTWVPYPKWRENDFDKNVKIVKYAVSSPINQSADDVWKYVFNDIENNKAFSKNEKQSEKQYLEEEYRDLGYNPPFWAYVNNIISNHSKMSHKFTLTGMKTKKGEKKEEIASNEKDGVDIGGAKYIAGMIEHSRLKATVFSLHKSSFRPGYLFFNKILILVMDPASGDVLYRRFFKFNAPPRIR